MSERVVDNPANHGWVEVDGDWIWDASGGAGSSVHIGDTPPSNPSEGQQWMEVPTDGEATMWIYDGAVWLQHPSGKDGADGADGGIEEAPQDSLQYARQDGGWAEVQSGLWTDNGGSISYNDGNVGIGVSTPSTTNLGTTIEIGNVGNTVWGAGVDNLNLLSNLYYNSGYKYANTDKASQLQLCAGKLRFYNAPSGTADTGVSLTERFVIDASGNVGMGVDNPADFISVYANNLVVGSGSGSKGLTVYSGADAFGALAFADGLSASDQYRGLIQYDHTNNALILYTDSASRMSIGADGRVDITGSLYVNGTPKIGTKELIETLSTLRNATKDETTVKGLRDAIGNAVGGLIEKFEAMQEESGDE